MIKKIIACLTICFIITGFISPVFSDASALPQPNWNDPGISEIINISDLTGWMLNGGTFDVSTYTNSEDFMNDYFNARTQTRLVSPDDVQEDYYEVLPGFGISNQLVAGNSFARPLDTNRVISSSFRDHSGYGRRFSVQANEALLGSGSLYDMKIPLLNEIEFANFVGYNHDALKIYSSFFNKDNPDPVPNPGPDFSYINYINNFYVPVYPSGSAELFSFNSIVDAYNSSNIYFTNLRNYTYIGDFNNSYNIHTDYNITNQGNIPTTLLSPLVTINVDTSDPNNVLVTYSSYDTAIADNKTTFGLYVYDNVLYAENANNYFNFNQSSFSGLSSAINYINSHYCNINLFVDDECWAYVSTGTPSPTITPEFPDAVGGEELPNTTWPISRPRAPYYTSVPGMLQAIEDAIQDDGKLDIDDLKPYLTDENGDPVPDPIFDPEPIPIPVPDPVNPDVVPGLPELPVIPLNMPGYNGVSVLAEIINFTNQSLPTSLIVTFWGIVFGIVILGLIKILHK